MIVAGVLVLALFVTTGATKHSASSPGLPTTITLTCSTFTALSGTYVADDDMMMLLNGEMLYYIANGNVFPSAAQVPAVSDTSGAVHLFATIAALQAFYKVVAGMWIAAESYQNQLNAGNSPTYPANTSTAC
jgi:hypothetical protein